MKTVMPPSVKRLLDMSYDTMEQAKILQGQGRHADALVCALFANEYVRAAKAIAGMPDAE
jgi:hypothetical protein